MIVDVATPVHGSIAAASAIVDGRRIALPTPVVSAEGFATFVVPTQWRGRATLELKTDARTLSYTL